MNHERQEGGDHYLSMAIQPWEALKAWLTPEQYEGYLLGTAISYLARYNVEVAGKGGITDVKKSRHTLEELEECLTKMK